ncbi:MAG TPA: cytochrome P450 [Solirubrobacteraceae bacterium]|nr:cytochrome P450 [Solirubrobacteraceae bacterium]
MSRFSIGASVSLDQLERDPHPVLAQLRVSEPVSWIPAMDCWLVTRHDLALRVIRDAATYTVDDPRFSTGRVIGPSMLSLDGETHARHRAPFAPPFKPLAVRDRFAEVVTVEARRLVEQLAPAGQAELRRSLAGPLAAYAMTRALGLGPGEVAAVLTWYDAIVSAVTEITAGSDVPDSGREAFSALRDRLLEVIRSEDHESLLAAAASDTELSDDEIVSNAAVLLFGGIETTEGMIVNAVLALLERPDELARVRREPSLLDTAIEESLRLEPAAAVVDRYAAGDVELDGIAIGDGDPVRVSIAAANRDPTVFTDPDRFDLDRPNAGRHLAFAHGPHVCVGVHLARLEALTALTILLDRLPALRLDPEQPAAVRGLVFRKPPALHVVW